jgi:putative drug exporter of the RND superfamily
MNSSPTFTARLAVFSARHAWPTLGIWVLALVGAFFLAGNLTITSDNSGTPTDAQRARDLIVQISGQETRAEEFILVEAAPGATDDAELSAVITDIVDQLRQIEIVGSAISYLDGATPLLTADGSKALIQVTLTVSESDDLGPADAVLDIITAANQDSGLRVTSIGSVSIERIFAEMVEETFAKGELIGIVAALFIMLGVFGTVVAPLMPILLAAVAIFAAVGIIATISMVIGLSEFTLIVTTMIGLAVGIDYSLFIVQRFREERDAGLERYDAIARAGATASRTVLFSGVAVTIALAGMLVMPDILFKSFGIGTITVVVTAVTAALTLLPALLGLLGDRINWLPLPVVGKRHSGDYEGGIWGRVTKVVAANPIVSVVATSALLVGLTLPLFTIELGNGGVSMLPESTDERHAFDIVISEFADGIITTEVVILAPDVNATAVSDAVASLIATLEADAFFGVPQSTMDPAGTIQHLSVSISGDISGPESRAGVIRLRDEYVPAAFAGTGAEVLIGGQTAFDMDSVSVVKRYVPLIMLAVLSASFVLLLIAFRSIVVPLKAVIMNLLSVGSAYGLVVLVFQHGYGADLFGFQTVPVIESWLPLFLFAILFGLSMDYHVFLLSRIKERYDETGDNSGSVIYGLHSTASIITGAALIMVAVFGGFALGPLAMFQQMGFGLAIAVILDATVVRMILVPASMELLGDRNWYFPSWLEWLPNISIEASGDHTISEPAPAGGAPDKRP